MLFAMSFIGCGSPSGFKSTVIVKVDGNESKDTNIKIDNNTSKKVDTLYQKLRASTVQIKTEGAEGTGWGTGFFIDTKGHIVTNNHVVVGANELRIAIKGEERLINAESIGYAECADLAVIKLTSPTNNAKYLNWHDDYITPKLNVVVSGFTQSVLDSENRPVFTYNEGIVDTQIHQISTPWISTEFFKYSAFTASGSSGAPVVEVETGKVVGVHYSGSRSSSSDKYAISGMEARNLVNRMINGENIHSIGISPEVYIDSSGKNWGVRVKDIVPDRQADRIGIKIDDFIIKLAGSSLTEGVKNGTSTLENYCSILKTYNPNNPDDVDDVGSKLSIEVLRTLNKSWIICGGEINGNKSLELKWVYDTNNKKWVDVSDDENILCSYL